MKERVAPKLRDQVAESWKVIRKIKAELKDKIQQLPDNPNIQRFGGGAFSISSSEIFKSETHVLAPEYYDFKLQHDALCLIIDKTDFVNLPKKLESIIKTGRFEFTGSGIHGRVRSTKNNKIVFNPKVLTALTQVLKHNL